MPVTRCWRGWGPDVDATGRKPVAKMESREPHSIRFSPTEWAAICESARFRGLEPAVFVRMLTIYALSISQAPAFLEASVGVPSTGLAASLGIPSGA